MDNVRDRDMGRVRDMGYRVRVRNRDRRSEPNLLRLLSSTKRYRISYGGPSYGGPEHIRASDVKSVQRHH